MEEEEEEEEEEKRKRKQKVSTYVQRYSYIQMREGTCLWVREQTCVRKYTHV